MSWIFRKIFRFGPFRTTLSKGGVGMSFGLPFCRIGVSPSGRKYISFGIPGTGLYFIKYLSNKKTIVYEEQMHVNKNTQFHKEKQDEAPWWRQKNLL